MNKDYQRVKEWRMKNLKLCTNCNVKQIYPESKFWQSCSAILRGQVDKTLRDAIYEKHHKSSAFALVRSRARTKMKQAGLLYCCMNCGYDKHVEVCHITPISAFSEDTMISEINSEENLMALCPNCHWEFDHGMLKLENINNLA